MTAITATDFSLITKDYLSGITQPASREEVEKLRNIYIRAQEGQITEISKILENEVKNETTITRLIYLSACQKARVTAKILGQLPIADQNILTFLADTCIESNGAA